MWNAEGTKRVWSSQPLLATGDAERALGDADLDALLSYSQPAQPDDLLLSPPDCAGTPPVLQRLVQRLTRVWLRCDDHSALRTLCDLLDEKRYSWRRVHPRIVSDPPDDSDLALRLALRH